MRRDADYVVAQRRVRIVDQFTGRIFADRSWRDGLHQAVEAKEGLPIPRNSFRPPAFLGSALPSL